MKGRVTYSDAFRRGVVERIERGMYKSLSEASRRNGIKGSLTVVSWIKKYGREDILPKRVKVETMNEVDELKAARKEIKELTLTGPNQAWASDITYIRTDEGFLYLALISDMWSRKIVGYHAGDTLEAEGALSALRMAAAGMPSGAKPVHHSDRGCQYCCHAYVEELGKHGLGVSMTEEAHCYENALAERVNGIMNLSAVERRSISVSVVISLEGSFCKEIFILWGLYHTTLALHFLTAAERRGIKPHCE